MSKTNFETHHEEREMQHMPFNHCNITKQELFDFMNKQLADVKDDEKIESVRGILIFRIRTRVVENS